MPIMVPAPVRRFSPTSWIASARVPVSRWPGRASEPRQSTHTTSRGWSTACAVCTFTRLVSACRSAAGGITRAATASTTASTTTRRVGNLIRTHSSGSRERCRS